MRTGFFFLFWCWFYSLSVNAQERTSIGLHALDTHYVKSYIVQTDMLSPEFADSAARRYVQAIKLCNAIGFENGAAYCHAKLANYYANVHTRIPDSRRHLHLAMQHAKNISPYYNWLYVYLYNVLGTVCSREGKHDSAMYYHKKALDVYDSLGLNMAAIRATIYTNMAAQLATARLYKESIAYFNMSLFTNLFNKRLADRQLTAALNYTNLGSVLGNKNYNNKDSADYYWDKALVLYKNLGRADEVQRLYAMKAGTGATILYRSLDKARHYIDSAILINPMTAGADVDILSSRASYYFYNGDYALAVNTGKRVIAICDANGWRERKNNMYEILSYAYAYLGDTLQGHHFQRLFMLLNDSLMNENIAGAVAQVSMQRRIAQQDKVLAERSLALYRQRNLLITGGVLGLLGLTFFLFYYGHNRQKRRLHQQQLHNLQQQQKIEQFQIIMEAEEQESKRIARELHDGLGVLLAAAKINHSLMGKILEPKHIEHATYQKSQAILDQMNQEIRTIVNKLMPDYITHKSFDEALITLAEKVNDPGKCTVGVNVYGAIRDLHPERSYALYRVVEEILHNALKHSGARNLVIQLMYHEEQLHIVIEDDGRGFDHKNVYLGMGLSNITTRINLLKGVVNLNSDPKNGTTYTMEIPY